MHKFCACCRVALRLKMLESIIAILEMSRLSQSTGSPRLTLEYNIGQICQNLEMIIVDLETPELYRVTPLQSMSSQGDNTE